MDWIDQKGNVTRDNEPYLSADGTQYPPGFPRKDIPGLTQRQPTAEESAAAAARAAMQFQASVVEAVQLQLDNFAHTRNYDGILSACTYATSAVPKFKAEGQYCVDLRDQTWAALYTLMAEVQAGTRTMPSTVQEVLTLLPVAKWPA